MQRKKRVRAWTDLLGLACTLHDPLLGLVPGLVECKETSLASSLDELIGLCDELGVEDPSRELGVWGDGIGGRIPGDLRDLGRWVDELCLDRRGWVDGRSALEPVGEEELGIVLADGCVDECQRVAQQTRAEYTHVWQTFLRERGEMEDGKKGDVRALGVFKLWAVK